MVGTPRRTKRQAISDGRPKDFAARLRSFRGDDLSQAKVAAAAGIHDRQVSAYERAIGLPSLPNAVRLAQALDVTVSDLIGDNLDDFDFEQSGLSGKADR